jgi:hypothetical protein
MADDDTGRKDRRHMNANTSTMAPTPDVTPDEELRWLMGLKNCLFHARVCNSLVGRARAARGADATEVENGQDAILDLERGIARAIERRERELGALVARAHTMGARL